MRVDEDRLTVPDRTTMTEAMELAARAPSVHNTQPWRWRFDGLRLRLHADPTRRLAAVDPHGRQLVISCGAMLDHVRTAFADRGWHAEVLRLPDPKRPDYLAAIGFRPWDEVPAELRERARAIERRRTDRLPLRAPEHWEQTLGALREVAAPYRIAVDVLAEDARPSLAAASRRFGDLRRLDLLYETELDMWTGHSDGADGVPATALVSDTEFDRVGVGRIFPSGAPSARRPGLDDRARLVVLSTAKSSVTHWLRTGEALSAVLLRCTADGLASCALTHITELPAGRELLETLVPYPGTPQVVIRVGEAPRGADPIESTPRRPLDEILSY
ncbi:Acg family FMN-binding oxidoreductase [Nocardia seriolae]|nr:hypothetical protein [Nocardia seriolae]